MNQERGTDRLMLISSNGRSRAKQAACFSVIPELSWDVLMVKYMYVN